MNTVAVADVEQIISKLLVESVVGLLCLALAFCLRALLKTAPDDLQKKKKTSFTASLIVPDQHYLALSKIVSGKSAIRNNT